MAIANLELKKSRKVLAQQEKQIQKLLKENIMFKRMYLKRKDDDDDGTEALEELNEKYQEFMRNNSPNFLEEGLDNL